jgi:hypothetical protein
MIDREHPLSVVRQARLLEISRGAVYYLNRPGFELTPRSWTVTIPPPRRCLSIGTPPD